MDKEAGAADKNATESTQGEVVEVSPSSTGVGEYKRNFSVRQIHVISLGGNIGSGLFIATGKALADGGPGSVLIGYTMVASCVAAILNTISEMTIAFPTSGNFVDYIDRFVDPALAFAAGFAEWLGWTAVVGSEATFFVVLVNYWADDKYNQAIWLTIFLVVVIALFLMPNQGFAWFEYVTTIIKLAALIIFIITAFAITLGAGPTGKKYHGETWTELPAFKNGFQGFGNCILLAIWAMGDQVLTGIMGGEAVSPRLSIAHATILVPLRIICVYVSSLVFITLLVPSNDPRLFGGSGVAASPFVIAANDAGIKGLPDFLNFAILLGNAAVAAESIYIASRILRAMANQGYIPRFIAKVDSLGRPRWALTITTTVAVILTYMNLTNTGVTVFTWFVSITSSSFFLVWFCICITSWRFRAALKAQNDPLFTQVYAYQCWAWPLPPIYLFTCSLLLLVACIYLGAIPIGSSHASVYNFFEYMIGVVIISVFGIGYKLIYRTPLRDPKTADLQTGRRIMPQEEIDMLNKYFRLPLWRRVLTYVQLW